MYDNILGNTLVAFEYPDERGEMRMKLFFGMALTPKATTIDRRDDATKGRNYARVIETPMTEGRIDIPVHRRVRLRAFSSEVSNEHHLGEEVVVDQAQGTLTYSSTLLCGAGFI